LAEEKTDLSLVGAELAHLHDESVGIRLKAYGIGRVASGLKHYARQSGCGLRNPNPRQQRIAYVDGLAFKFRSERSIVQIKINSVRTRETMRLVLHLIFQIEDNGA
jgi:hypothetical protein